MRYSLRLIVLASLLGTFRVAAQGRPDVDALLERVGQKIEDYYRRAQNVICTERTSVQPVGHDYAPSGFARITESELHVETDATADGDGMMGANIMRRLLKVNGRPPREKDQKAREGCTDGNPISPEPLAFLLPAHRSEYTFVSSGFGKGKDRNTLVIDYTSAKPEGKGELTEDPRGHEGCFQWSVPAVTKGRVWIDAQTFEVVRIEERLAGLADISVPWKLQRKHNLANSITLERHDTTINYKRVVFQDPDEAMLLPQSIDTLMVVRGGLESVRRRQAFSDYRRFVTGARLVK
jgi:hypothetical protein